MKGRSKQREAVPADSPLWNVTSAALAYYPLALLLMGGQVVVLGALGMRLYQLQVQEGARSLYAPARLPANSHWHLYEPETDKLGAGYNIIQSKIALGSGGMWGKGFWRERKGIGISCRRSRPISLSP